MSEAPGAEESLLVGLFIGGASSRMGQTKGLLLAHGEEGAPGETIVARTVRIVRDALPRASLCLVGNLSEFDELSLERIPDARDNCGPLGGLVSLLRAAENRGIKAALALGCDFPFLNERIVRRLAREAPDASVLAPFVDDRYQPLVARYAAQTLPEFESALRGAQFGLQAILKRLGATSLPLEFGDVEALMDWDTPEDVARSYGSGAPPRER